ncbi:MAG: hypothetical protein ACYDAC_02625 [Candidatus Dormibacteria bacterium]
MRESAKRSATLLAAAVLGAGALTGSLVSPLRADADTPSGPYTVTPQQSVTYQNTTGVAGWPDPNGAPAPVCTSAECDRQTVTLGAGSSPPSDVFSLAVTVTYTSTNTTLGNCLDLAIENSASTTALAFQACAPSGGTVTDPSVTPGTSYVVEVDGNASNGVAAPSQPFSVSVVAAASLPSTGGGSGGGAPPAHPFSFTHQVSVDVQRGDGEPDLAISNDNNTLFTASPYGFSTTVSLLWKSSDGGTQWDNLHGSSVGEVCPNPAAAVLRPDCSRGGGDAEVQFSQPATSGGSQTVQFADLNGLDSISCAYSANGGDTFTDLLGYGMTSTTSSPQAGAACNEGGTANANCTNVTSSNAGCATLGTDRQWMQVWPKADQQAGATSDKLYMTFDTGEQPPGGDAAIFSNDNGQSWQVACTTTTGSSCLGGANAVGSRPGPLVINPTLLNVIPSTITGVTSGTYPTLYEFMGTSSNGTEVNISCDGGQTWNHVTTSNNMAGSTTNDFVAGAMDSSGELYTAFAVANDPNPWRIWFTHSTDSSGAIVGDCSVPVQGTSWSAPVALTGPPSSDGVGATVVPALGDAVMPWLTAGAAGRVDLVYYGTATSPPFSPDSGAANWYMHMAQTLDGGSTWSDEQATETPMHTKSICFSGIGCTAQTPPGGDRNLLDFFQVKTDSNGRAIIIYTDDNNSAACAATCSAGIGLISEVQQATGPSLLTGDVPALTGSLAQSLDVRTAGIDADITDPVGDAIVAAAGHNVLGSNVPALDITDLKVCTVTTASCPVANTAASKLSFLFGLSDLSGGLGGAVTVGHTGAIWLVTWRTLNDVWFAEASTDATGTLSCSAGRPLSIYNDGEPKLAEYTASGNPEAVTIPSSGCIVKGNTIEIDVPTSAVGNIDVSSSSTAKLYGVTGWTGESTASLPASVCASSGVNPSLDACSGPLAPFDNADESAPMDVAFITPPVGAPEAPLAPLLLLAGTAAGLAILAGRRRRRLG